MGGPARGERSLAARRRGVLMATLAAVVLLFGGVQVASAALPGAKAVGGGAVEIDDGPVYRTSVRLPGEGWSKELHSRAATSDGKVFTRGGTRLEAMSVEPPGDRRADARELWAGLGDVLRTRDREIRLAEPAPVRSDQGVQGLMGATSGGERDYLAVIYPSPSHTSAAQLLISSEQGAAGLGGEADALAATAVVFTPQGKAHD